MLTIFGEVFKNDDLAKQTGPTNAERLQLHREKSGPVMARLPQDVALHSVQRQPWPAPTSATSLLFMTLINTTELAGEDPRRYLVALLQHPEQVAADPARWLPWTYRHTLQPAAEKKAA